MTVVVVNTYYNTYYLGWGGGSDILSGLAHSRVHARHTH